MDPTCGLVEKFRDLVFDLIGEHLLYLVCYGQNIEQLNERLVKLTLERISIQHRMDEATNNVERIEEKVHHWLHEVDEISEQVEQLRKEGQAKRECSITSCPNPWLRYKLSKRAKEMAKQAADILGNAKFDTVSYRLPPQSMPELTNGESNEGIDSRVPIIDQIMEALRNSSVNMIGLCGLGGVGKTTIAKEIAKNQKMFEKAIVATVSKELNIENIQGQIAEELGMQLNEKTEKVRAKRLHERLEREKNMLLILDDLWVELDLRKVGIPFLDVENNSKKNEGCKILLTSRDKTLLSDLMKCQKIIEVSILLEDEAWELFKRIAELSVDSSSPELISIATDIVRKCGGLPLFIATLAKALRNKDLNQWKNALARLNHPLRRNITGIKEADPILKLSYDHLSSPENKHIFLLASMLSHDPSIEDLLMYSVGLDFLEHTEKIEDAYVGLSAIVSKLKSLNLFLDSFSRHHVTMHDVIRDVALPIASKELPAFIMRHRPLNEWPDENKLEDFKGICLQESDISVDLPEELHGPRLKFFLLNSTKHDLTIPKMFFKSSMELKVLAFTKVHFSSLPLLSYLKKLKTFCLHSCLLEDITEIKTLKNLKVLSLAYSEIERLPVELVQLTSLQMLNLSHCSKLKVIPEKLLSSFKKLEVLYMEKSFDEWKVEGSNDANENASLDELKDLPISSIGIHIPNVSMLPESLFLAMNLKRYRILIGKCWKWWQCNHENPKILKLELERGIHLKRGVQKLLEGVEDFHLYGSNGLDNVLYSHEGRGFPHLKHLCIENNDDIKYIVLNSSHHEVAFPILESLKLQDLKALEKLCEGMSTIEFNQLRTLRMRNLPALTADPCLKDGATNNVSNKMLRSLFSKVLLPKLEILELCNLNIEQLSHNPLSNLKTLIVKGCAFVKLLPLHLLKSLNNLEIHDCVMLKMVFDFEDLNNYKEIESSSVVVPLKTLKLSSLPKLKNVWSNHNQGNVSFPSLRSVGVYDCESLTHIFLASSIAKGMLCNLEELRIHRCGINVIVANDQASESATPAFKFPRLTSLQLYRLRKLRNFYPETHTLEWPNLQRLSIEDCDLFKTFEKEVLGSSEIHEKESTLNSNYPLLSRDQVLLEILELRNLDIEQLSHNSLCSLKTLIVKTCGFVKLLPFHVLKSLNNLEELEIEECRMLKMVFDFEVLNDYKEIESSSMVVPLKTLKLKSLPKLKNVWSNHNQGNISFPSLRSVHVFNCESLTSIFPASSIAKGMLRSLEELRIYFCGIDVIVANDQASNSAATTFKFPRLTSLDLYRLPKLRNFYPERHTLEWPNLQRLSIEDCDLFEIFEKEVSGSSEIHEKESMLNLNYPQLSRDQVIHNLGELRLQGKHVEMIGSGQFPMYRFPNVKVLDLDVDEAATISYKSLWNSFPNLEQLQLRGDFEVAHDTDDVVASFSTLTFSCISNMRSLLPSLVSSQNLTHLQVISSDRLTTLMTSSTARSLVHITHLSISFCDKMEEIITKQEGENDEDKEIIFSKLKELKFYYMQRLKRFCGYSYTFRFPLLDQMIMKSCPRFQIFSPGLIDTPSLKSVLSKEDGKEHHEIWDTNLNKTFNQQRFVASRDIVLDKYDASMIRNDQFPVESCSQVEILNMEGFVDDEWLTFPYTLLERFPKLKQLHVKDSSFKELFSSHASLHNLTKLKVFRCHQLVYLVENSTAKCLVNLETLEISDCEKLEEIVKKESSEDMERGGIIFNELRILKLNGLPRMKTEDINLEDRAIGVRLSLHFDHNQVLLPKLEQLELSNLLNNSISLIWGEQLLPNSFNNLKTLIVRSCGSLKSLPLHVLKSLNKLEKLQVSKCDMLEMVFGFEDLNDCKEMESSSMVVPLNLTHLEVQSCQGLTTLMTSSAARSLAHLTHLEVQSCQGLTTLMTSSAVRSLAHLTHLSISYCHQIKEIITKQEGEDEQDKEIVFSKLKLLQFDGLNRLKRFCSHNYNFSFSLLERVIIKECPQLTMFCPGAIHAPLLKSIRVGNLFGPSTNIWMTNLNNTIQHRFTIKEKTWL